jgi:hypothetical protein
VLPLGVTEPLGGVPGLPLLLAGVQLLDGVGVHGAQLPWPGVVHGAQLPWPSLVHGLQLPGVVHPPPPLQPPGVVHVLGGVVVAVLHPVCAGLVRPMPWLRSHS